LALLDIAMLIMLGIQRPGGALVVTFSLWGEVPSVGAASGKL